MADMHPYRKQIAIAMADGKERTVSDVCVAIGLNPEGKRAVIKNHLDWMKRHGLLTSEPIGAVTGAHGWRKAV